MVLLCWEAVTGLWLMSSMSRSNHLPAANQVEAVKKQSGVKPMWKASGQGIQGRNLRQGVEAGNRGQGIEGMVLRAGNLQQDCQGRISRACMLEHGQTWAFSKRHMVRVRSPTGACMTLDH